MSEFVEFQPILKSKQEKEETPSQGVLEAFTTNDPPILKPRKVEMFVSEEETKEVMTRVFIAVGLMIGAMFLAFLFIWTFNKEKTLFISVYATFMLMFAAMIIIVASVIREQITNKKVFYVIIGSSVFVALLNIVVAVIFGVMASKRLRKAFVPQGVQDYINP